MYFGISKDIITPPFNMVLACARGNTGNYEYVHDDVFVRCLAMSDGENKTVLMSMDLLFHERSLNNDLAAYAKEKYGVEPSAFVLGCTHDHIAPSARGYSQDFANEEYEAYLLDRAKKTLDRAMNTMFEGTIEHTTFEAFFSISRRGYKDGVFMNFADPKHKRDTEFGVLVVRDLFGDVKSVVMSYGCHPVFYPADSSLSGEFPARVCQLIDANYYGCISLYFQSAGGDVRPMATVVDGKFAQPLPFSHVDRFAKSIADDVIKAVDSKNYKFDLNIASDEFAAVLPMEEQSKERFKELCDEFIQYGEKNINYINANYIANEGGHEILPRELPLHCQTVKLCDEVYIATMGGEPTNHVKECVKECFKDKKMFFIGYTDCCAYVVNDFELDEGGYEALCYFEYRLIGPFKKGIDEKIQKGFKASLKKLK